MALIFSVRDQFVKQVANKAKYIAPIGSQSSLKIHIDFDEYWNEFPKRFIQVSKGSLAYNLMLNENNETTIPSVLTKGIWDISVFGLSEDDTTKRYTTVASTLCMVKGFVEGGVAPDPPSEDYYAKLFKAMEELAKEVEGKVDEAAEYLVACKQILVEFDERLKQAKIEITAEVKNEIFASVYTKAEIDENIKPIPAEEVTEIIEGGENLNG